MPRDSHELDLILATRLDLLGQAVEEVNGVIAAMEDQRSRLADVEAFLKVDGRLSGSEEDLLTNLGDAISRLRVMLRGSTSARSLSRAVSVIGPSSAREASTEVTRQQRLQEVLDLVGEAESIVESRVTSERQKAYESFQDVSRWSVAGLVDRPLKDAVRDYQRLICEIRDAKDPWRRYLDETPRRGQELFTRYLDLLAGMAVRGFGLDANIMSDVDALIRQLMEPLGDEDRPVEHHRSPLALMGLLGKRHVPLGYPKWSLWALPLVGRTVGELVVASFLRRGLIRRDIDQRLQVYCADIYAQYVLGPSYVHAAVFLEFDPSLESAGPEAPCDCLRVQLLLEKLLDLGGGVYRSVLEPIASRVAEEWTKARQAVGGSEVEIDTASRNVLEEFYADLASEYPHVAYDARYLEEAAENGRTLASMAAIQSDEGVTDHDSIGTDSLRLSMRDLITAMWLARLDDPPKARLIHDAASKVAQQARVLTRPTDLRTGLVGRSIWAS